MSRLLSRSDFRANRAVMERIDFAYAPRMLPPPSDPVDRSTWVDVQSLPEDVSIRTSDHHGSQLRRQQAIWGAYIDVSWQKRSPVCYGVLDAADELQAVTFNALHGFYRPAIASLRTALEVLCVGCSVDLGGSATEFARWQKGTSTITFGSACDRLRSVAVVKSLERHLLGATGDTLFASRKGPQAGGWARRLHSTVSEFSHGRPGFTAADLWESNGPVYEERAFNWVSRMFVLTSVFGFILVALARPKTNLPPIAAGLLRSREVCQEGVLVEAGRAAFPRG